MHEEKGVKFHFESGIKEFVGIDGAVSEAILSTGVRLPADLCILGVGKYLSSNNFVPCDLDLEVLTYCSKSLTLVITRKL